MMIPAALLAFVVGGPAVSGGAGQTFRSVPASEAASFVGSKKVVCGGVAAVKPAAAVGESTLLGLERPFPDPALTVVINAKDRNKFPRSLEVLLLNGEVCVEGKIEQVGGRTEMRVSDIRQFKLAVAGKPSAKFAETVARPGPGVVNPSLLTKVEPKYTPAAMAAKIRGGVELEAVVREDGTVGDMQIVHSLDPLFGLDENAMRAASHWVFTPATRDGRPIACVVRLVMTFDLH